MLDGREWSAPVSERIAPPLPLDRGEEPGHIQFFAENFGLVGFGKRAASVNFLQPDEIESAQGVGGGIAVFAVDVERRDAERVAGRPARGLGADK